MARPRKGRRPGAVLLRLVAEALGAALSALLISLRGSLVNRNTNGVGVNWSALAFVAMLAGFCLWGALANRLGLGQFLGMLGFGAGLLLTGWLGQWKLARAAAQPLSWGQKLRNAAVFVGWLGVMAGLGWWYYTAGWGK